MQTRIVTAVALATAFWTPAAISQEESKLPPETSAEFHYSANPESLYYTLTIEADFGSKKYDKLLKSHVVYDVEEVDDDKLSIARVTSKAISTTRSYRSDHPLFQIGPIAAFQGSTGPTSIIKHNGELVSTQTPLWIAGLPIDAACLPFPPIYDKPTWNLERPITVIRNSRARDRLHLLPLSSKIKPRFGSTIRQTTGSSETSILSLENTTVKRIAHDDQTMSFSETFALDGSAFQPSVSYSGSSTFTVSRQLQSLESLRRVYHLVSKEPNQEISVDITISLERMSATSIVKYKQEKAARDERTLRMRQDYKARQESLPALDDRSAVAEALASDDEKLFEMLAGKLNSNRELEPDPELARVVYNQFFRFGSVDYSASKLVAKLDPKMAKTVSLLDKCMKTYGFDIAFTGDEIPAQAMLDRGELICYPDSDDDWLLGTYYGEVDGVMVLEEIKPKRKFVATKRVLCRFPADGLIAPSLQSKSRD